MAQLVEHILGKDEVTGSTPVVGSSFFFDPADLKSNFINIKTLFSNKKMLDSSKGLSQKGGPKWPKKNL